MKRYTIEPGGDIALIRPDGKWVDIADLRAELLPVLKRLEWLGNEMNELWCEECRKENPHHAPDCAIARIIAELEKP